MKNITKKLLLALGLSAFLMLTGCKKGEGSSSESTQTNEVVQNDDNQTETTKPTPETPNPTDCTSCPTTDLAFSNKENVELDTYYTTNSVTVQGVNGITKVKTSNGSIIINGEDMDVKEYEVKNGDKLAIKVKSSGDYSTAVKVKVELQGKVDYFSVTTKSDDSDTISNPVINSIPTQNVDDNGGGLASTLLTVTGTDFDANAEFSIEGNPTGGKLTIGKLTGKLVWDGDVVGNQTYSITVKVLNPDDGGQDTEEFTLKVNDNG